MCNTNHLLFLLVTTLVVSEIQGSCYRYYENSPASDQYLNKNCKKIVLQNNQDAFNNFIPVSSLQNNYAIQGQILNTIICFKGLHTPEIVTNDKPSKPVNGDKFTWVVLNYEGKSRLYHTDTSEQCDTIYSPNAFSPYVAYCMNFILHDNYDGSGLGRATYTINNLYPNSLSCYDVPPGDISGTKYISFGTWSDLGTGSESYIYYDCKRYEPPTPPPPGRAPVSVQVDVRQNQYVNSSFG